MYNPTRIDFDIEGGYAADPVSISRIIYTANKMKSENPNLQISFTLAADPYGFNAYFVAIKSLAELNNLNFVPTVNIMAMDYGPDALKKYNNNMYDATIATVNQTTAQLAANLPNFNLTANQ